MANDIYMQERAMNAGKNYLHKKGYELVAKCEDFLIVENEAENILAIVHVSYSTDTSVIKAKPSVEEFESVAIRYFMGHTQRPCEVRFDTMSLTITNPERALLRHCIRCY